jgi:cytoskeletal protein CcmA (bactofilin family)
MSDKIIVNGKHTLVEEGTELQGTVKSNVPIVVMGKVEGEVNGPAVHVTTTGVVAGKVKVNVLFSAGEVAGELEADTVRISGRVRDKTVIRARTLEVTIAREAGIEVLFGECELAVGDEPNKQAAIDAALAPAPIPVLPAVTTPVDPKAAAAAAAATATTTGKLPRRKGASEAWDEATAANATPPVAPTETEEDGVTRKRKTLPPPMS